MLRHDGPERFPDHCMRSEAIFTEIYQGPGSNEVITFLNGKPRTGRWSVCGCSNEADENTLMPLPEESVDVFGKKEADIRLERVTDCCGGEFPGTDGFCLGIER